MSQPVVRERGHLDKMAAFLFPVAFHTKRCIIAIAP